MSEDGESIAPCRHTDKTVGKWPEFSTSLYLTGIPTPVTCSGSVYLKTHLNRLVCCLPG